MKRVTVFMFIAFVLAGSVFAQERGRQREPNRQREPSPVNIQGTFKLERGFVAVQSGENVYVVPVLNRYIGFIDGLREGNNVSVEGFANRNIVHPTKVTIAGNAYDFRNNAGRPGRGDVAQQRPERPDRRGFDQQRQKPGYGRNNAPPARNAPGPRNSPNRCGCCW